MQAGLSCTWELSETILQDDVILCCLRESVLQQVMSENNDYCAYACQPPKLLRAACQLLLECRPLSVSLLCVTAKHLHEKFQGLKWHCWEEKWLEWLLRFLICWNRKHTTSFKRVCLISCFHSAKTSLFNIKAKLRCCLKRGRKVQRCTGNRE